MKGGVCFCCWGTKRDLPAITAELWEKLQNLRNEYRQARRKGAAAKILKEIEGRGVAARRAYDRQIAENAHLRARFEN